VEADDFEDLLLGVPWGTGSAVHVEEQAASKILELESSKQNLQQRLKAWYVATLFRHTRNCRTTGAV
jgi:hypothetical protein